MFKYCYQLFAYYESFFLYTQIQFFLFCSLLLHFIKKHFCKLEHTGKFMGDFFPYFVSWCRVVFLLLLHVVWPNIAPYFFTFHMLNLNTIECKEAWNFQRLLYWIWICRRSRRRFFLCWIHSFYIIFNNLYASFFFRNKWI